MQTVLVIDDEYGIAEVLEATLLDEGYRVLVAINGRQGLERLQETPADIILLDFMMPVMDGPATLKALAANPAYAAIPVVVMSSLPEDSVAARSNGGYAAYLRKPFRLQAVLDKIAEILAARKRS